MGCSHAQARRTARTDEDTDPGEEEGGADNPPGPEPGPKLPVEEQERLKVIATFKRTLLFSQGAATALYDDQVIQSLDTLREINDDMTKEMCRVIRKPGDDVQGYGISELSVNHLKLIAF